MNSKIDAYDHAAAEYDNQLPEFIEEREIECAHVWKLLGRSKGHEYYRCARCGEEGEM